MYLSRIDIQGFKTFAQKTTLHFPKAQKDHKPLTVIVGPNGSGKSNLADAIRWCLGEQSLKNVRGKESHDVIFSGSEGRARVGCAEVILTFEEEDGEKEVPTEVSLGRRLYRDGESAYVLNGEEVRLQDIHMFLAEAGVGQRSYAVIGQGMIDQIITASPHERKQFFDDAAGIRGFTLKRHQARLKLEKAAQNIKEGELLLAELTPRLALLARQVKKLGEREEVEGNFVRAATTYYGALWAACEKEEVACATQTHAAQEQVRTVGERIAAVHKELDAQEQSQVQVHLVQTQARKDAQHAYKTALDEAHRARRTLATCEQEIALARVRAQATWAPLPLEEIVRAVTEIKDEQEKIVIALKREDAAQNSSAILEGSVRVEESIRALYTRLVRPPEHTWKPSEEDEQKRADAEKQVAACEAHVIAQEALLARMEEETPVKENTHARTLHASLRTLHEESARAQRLLHEQEIVRARLEAKKEGLLHEMRENIAQELVIRLQEARNTTTLPTQELDAVHAEMRKYRAQRESIGAIDEDVVREHEEVKTRYDFLVAQKSDLENAMESTQKIIATLDKEIATISERAFVSMNEEFQKYFAVLFGGGSCRLERVKKEGEEQEGGEDDGVEIFATPPGKQQKGLQLLSGGERALTSIALLCAVMATNPSPFVVLDEVDAALDEANTVRFANILAQLRNKTQFLVITHNRATMEKADALYGVTMGGDGVSQLISVKLEDYIKADSARR